MSQNNNNNNIINKEVEDWTVEDVGNWLINVGYEKYKDLFIGNFFKIIAITINK